MGYDLGWACWLYGFPLVDQIEMRQMMEHDELFYPLTSIDASYDHTLSFCAFSVPIVGMGDMRTIYRDTYYACIVAP